MKIKINETIRRHFDQSPIKNRLVKGGKIKDYSDLSRFLALKSLEKTLVDFLTPFNRHIKRLKKKVKKIESDKNYWYSEYKKEALYRQNK